MSSSEPEKHTILVVDDEPTILKSLRRMLQSQYHVLTTSSVEEAFALLEQNDVHVVMSDQRMPEMNGVEFLAIVKDLYPDCARVLFTGYTDTQSAIEAINSGQVYCYIPKPCVPSELKLMLRQATEHYDLVRERRRLLEQLRDINGQLERRNKDLQVANNKLQELDRLKNVFMEVVSHELNTPIAIAQGYTVIMHRELNDATSPTLKKAAQGILKSTTRLGKITDKILKVLHSQTPQVTLQLERVSLSELCERVHETVSPFLGKRAQTLCIQCASELEAIIDNQMITDAVVNLVVNAIKFSPDGDTITLGATIDDTDESRIRIDVIDTGVGIKSEDLPRIFQPFFGTFDSRHHSSGDFEFGKRGIGLGLSIVKKFAELHNGEVSVVTERQKGSHFAIFLPQSPC